MDEPRDESIPPSHMLNIVPMKDLITLFVGTFFTLVAIINPLEAMPIYLKLLHGQGQKEHRAVAIKSCTYALILMFVFLLRQTQGERSSTDLVNPNSCS